MSYAKDNIKWIIYYKEYLAFTLDHTMYKDNISIENFICYFTCEKHAIGTFLHITWEPVHI